MHRSRTRRIQQRGGDYISSVVSTIAMPSSITVSSISAITAAAGLSSIGQWTQLTVDQINAMIQAINSQITTDGNEISRLTSTIAAYDRQIDIDPNYQRLFNDADFVYTSTLSEYIRISSLVETKRSTFQYDNRLLSSYSTQAAQYLSSLDAARRDYSSLLLSSGQIVPLIQTELSTLQSYQSSFTTLSSFCGQYSGTYIQNLQSTLQVSTVTLAQLNSTLSQFQIDYNSLSTAFVAAPTDQVLSTNVQSKLRDMRGTRDTISSNQLIYDYTLGQTRTLSTSMGGCDVRLVDLDASIKRTLSNIQIYAQISTTYSAGSPEYWAQVSYWSTVEAAALSSISSYTYERTSLIGQRDALASTIAGLKTQLRTKLASLDTAANTFYSQKQTELISEVQEFLNASNECNAYVGVLTAELMLKKLDLFDVIDTVSFYIASTVNANDMTTKGQLETQRTNLVGDQTALQTQVDRLNPIDMRFNELVDVYTNELLFKRTFIQTRSSLHAVERNVIAYPQTRDPSKTYYQTEWANMNTAINSANGKIVERQQKWSSIQVTLDSVKNALQIDPLSKYSSAFSPFIPYYPYTYTQIPPQNITQTVSVISEYALLPAIDFTAPLPSYSL